MASKKYWPVAAGSIVAAGVSYLAYRTYQQRKSGGAAKSAAAGAAGAAVTGSGDSIPTRRVVRIGTRESKLAMWQAEHVRDRLAAAHPTVDFQSKYSAVQWVYSLILVLIWSVVGMTTLGDRDLVSSLSNFTSKGVFTKELDAALLAGSIDIAVHCMKDLPTKLPAGIDFAAVLKRGETEDALIVHSKHAAAKRTTLDSLPAGSVIGTSALRRVASIAKHYPQLRCKDVRGNVNTRLAKLDSGEYDALILADVGLRRLGFGDRITQTLNSERFGYAVGQGALAVVCREGDASHQALCAPLTHEPTQYACAAERGLLAELEGGCKVPIAVRAIMYVLTALLSLSDSMRDSSLRTRLT